MPASSLVLRVRLEHKPGQLSRVTGAIADQGAVVGSLELVELDGGGAVRELTLEAPEDRWDAIADAVDEVDGAEVLERIDQAVLAHQGGLIEQRNRRSLRTAQDLATFYTPGVAKVSEAVADDPARAYDLTAKGSTVAIVSDGSATLGLGNVGPLASLPVLEGKAMLLKELADVNAVPLCMDADDADGLVHAIRAIAPGFGALNLEDIGTPACFHVERALAEALDVPVFHDDQHGTAVVVLAGLLNALRLTDRNMEDLRVLVCGTGAAGVAITRTLLDLGVREIVGADDGGVLHADRDDLQDGDEPAARVKRWYAERTNPDGRTGETGGALEGMDAFIGVSVAGAIEPGDLDAMADDAIVFTLANPDPEVPPEEAGKRARVVATGRSDHPNQINNVLCFPGLLRGVLDARARALTEPMKRAAADAIANLIEPDDLRDDLIVPSVLNRDVPVAVAQAVAEAARERDAPLAALDLDA